MPTELSRFAEEAHFPAGYCHCVRARELARVPARAIEPGACVAVEWSARNLGGTTDAAGDYFIANLDPGTYTLRASFVGYADVTHFIRTFRRANGATPAAWRTASRTAER